MNIRWNVDLELSTILAIVVSMNMIIRLREKKTAGARDVKGELAVVALSEALAEIRKMNEEAVKVYIYDISKGLARNLSLGFLGKQIDGVWHTGIVIYGQEFYFGGGGIESCPPMGTILGSPDVIHDLGHTQIPYDVFMEYLQDLSISTFRPECYHLLEHNCNTFSSELAQFLTGKDIPSHITNLPAEVMSTPLGQMLKPFVDAMSVSPEGGRPLFSPATGSSRPAPSNKAPSSGPTPSSSSIPKANVEKSIPSREPVTYKVKVEQILEECKTSREEVVKGYPVDGPVLTEVMDYISTDDCTWSLGRQHIQTLGVMVLNSDCDASTRHLAGTLLQVAALEEDVVMAAKHDPGLPVQKLLCAAESVPEQLLCVLAKMVANFVSSKVGYTFLSSEAAVSMDTGMSTNLKLMLRVCVQCLLSKQAECWEHGAAIVTNLIIHGVSENVTVELSSALLQCLTNELSENTANMMLWCIVQLMKKSEEVRDLAAVLAVDWGKFSTLSSPSQQLANQAKELVGV